MTVAPTAPSRVVPAWAAPHLRPGEVAVWWCRPSRLGLVPIAGWLLVALGGLVLSLVLDARYGDGEGRFAPAGVALLLAVGGILLEGGRRVIHLFFTAFLVTDARFYEVTSFVSTRVRSVPVSRITLVDLRQGVVGRLLGLWSAKVVAYGQAGATLKVPAIREGERLLREASEAQHRGANVAWLLRGD